MVLEMLEDDWELVPRSSDQDTSAPTIYVHIISLVTYVPKCVQSYFSPKAATAEESEKELLVINPTTKESLSFRKEVLISCQLTAEALRSAVAEDRAASTSAQRLKKTRSKSLIIANNVSASTSIASDVQNGYQRLIITYWSLANLGVYDPKSLELIQGENDFEPVAMTKDSEGNLYVYGTDGILRGKRIEDTWDEHVCYLRVNQHWKEERSVGGIAMKSGRLIISYPEQNMISEYDKTRGLLSKLPDFNGVPLSSPHGVVVNSKGKIIVCDSNNNRILMLESLDDRWGQHIETGSPPSMVAVDEFDNIFVGFRDSRKIVCFDEDCQFLTEFEVTGQPWVESEMIVTSSSIYVKTFIEETQSWVIEEIKIEQ